MRAVRRRCLLWLSLLLAVGTSAIVVTAPADAAQNPRKCRKLNGLPVLAYNISCQRALRYTRKLPASWGGANNDIAVGHGLPNGIALLFRMRDMDTVLAARDTRNAGRPRVSRLDGAPAVWMAMPYGE